LALDNKVNPDVITVNIIRRMADVVVVVVNAYGFDEQRQLVYFRLDRPDVGLIIAHNIASKGNHSGLRGRFMEQFGSSHADSLAYKKLVHHDYHLRATHIGFSEDVAAVNEKSRETFLDHVLDAPKKKVSFLGRLRQAFEETIAPSVVSVDSKPVTVEIKKDAVKLSCAPKCKLKDEEALSGSRSMLEPVVYDEGDGDDRRRVFEMQIPGVPRENVKITPVDGRYVLEIFRGTSAETGGTDTPPHPWRRDLPFDASWVIEEGIRVEDGILSVRAARSSQP
jgi:hypothetical protein